ncbi:MAG TPA: restriction endonuclease [Solirubrobacterales bacterium]|jgi:restriction system protein
MWGLHHRGAHELVTERCIAVGWPDAGDLTDLPEDREVFKGRLREAFPDRSEAWVANAAGQLLRFRHVMEVGELLVYSRKSDRTINIARITGDYAYEPGVWGRYPNRRTVEWLKTEIPRDRFTSGCLYEIGAALSVFTIKEHRQEILAMLNRAPSEEGVEGAAAEPTIPELEPVSEDEPDVERISELTGDFILKEFNTTLKGHEFAKFCGWLFEALGYSARVSPPGADGGVDIVATRDPLGVERPLLKVQCKSGSGPIGSSEVQALNGTLADAELGVFIAVGGYTNPARHAAAGMPKMRLIGPEELLELILTHYPQLPDEAKQAIPLRRVWMPDRPSASD